MARILVIDDDADVLSLVLEVLESAGHQVDCAHDGGPGVESQREHPADLVITDILMPGKEGLETIRDLKAEFPDLKVIAMSGGGRLVKKLGYFYTAKELGADVVLRKPFDSKVLLEAVNRVLKMRTK